MGKKHKDERRRKYMGKESKAESIFRMMKTDPKPQSSMKYTIPSIERDAIRLRDKTK